MVSKENILTIEEFEKVIRDNLNPTIKELLKSPHRYYINFDILVLNPGLSTYYLEIVRYKKLSISINQKLTHSQRVQYAYKEEKTDDVRMKCLKCRSLPNEKPSIYYDYTSVVNKGVDGYYYRGVALYKVFDMLSDDLTIQNAKKIAKSIYIDY